LFKVNTQSVFASTYYHDKGVVMKLKMFVVLSITVLLSVSALAADKPLNESKPPPDFFTLPAGVDIRALPEPILEDPPVYLDVDSDGNVYRLSLGQGKSGLISLSYEPVTDQELTELRSQHAVVLQNRAEMSLPGESLGSGGAAASSSSCTFPTALTFVGVDGVAVGNFNVAGTNRPAGTNTQWLIYDFYTTDYRGAGSHMISSLFHKDINHGWGNFIGDSSQLAQSCGTTAFFNSQIEGWMQLAVPEPPEYPETTATWQNSVFNGSNSCGKEMYDGPIVYYGVTLPRYRMEMHASTGHWVAYRIMKLIPVAGLQWYDLTGWKFLDVDTGYWPNGVPTFDDAAQGILMGANNGYLGPNWDWSLTLSGIQCGWF
jgi:hypothetical protein